MQLFKARFGRGRPSAIRIAGLIALLLAVGLMSVVAFRYGRRPAPQMLLTSCANHSVQMKFLVIAYAQDHERFPEGTDTRRVIKEMDKSGAWPRGWTDSYSSACPEAFLRDRSIGYVYVGSGLPTHLQWAQPPVVSSARQKVTRACSTLDTW